jgi:hypothetical protein
MKESNDCEERRRYPRLPMDLPLEYQTMDIPKAYGGIAVNGNETGLLIRSIKDIPVGTKLNVIVLFPSRCRLTKFEALAEIVWKDFHLGEDWDGYKYGLKFIHIDKKDQLKLKPLLTVTAKNGQ